jgi:Secretion system C-terminal sorting domain
MKTNLIKNCFSFVAVISFLFIAAGYYEVKTSSEYLGNGIYKETKETVGAKEDGAEEFYITTIAQKDVHGHWHGPAIIEKSHVDGNVLKKVTYVHGVLHGKVETKINGELISVVCYNMGNIVPCEGNLVSNIANSRSSLSAFEILEQKYPWYTFENLPENQNIRDSFQLFMNAIEKKLNTYTLNNDNFDTYFNEVDGSIDSFSGYSNWYQLTGRFASGETEARNFEFRRAVIERYTTTKEPIADIIHKRYPYFRQQVENEFNISTTDFDAFCNEFDAKMDVKMNIPNSDPFFIDSLDRWMGQIFTDYLNDDNLAFRKIKVLLSQSIKSGYRYDASLQNLVSEYLERSRTDTLPVHEAILTLLFTKVLEVDAIKLSIKEACLTNQNVPLPPEIVTNILGQNTEGVRVRGLITFDGNATITKSGIVWDTVYNPELTPNNYINPDNANDFNVFIGGLIPGKRYFVRSYAINSAGLVYGNTLEFTAGEVSRNVEIENEGVSWRAHPNPADDQIKITFEEPLPAFEIFVYTLNGYQIYNRSYKNMPEIAINTCDWPEGTYIIEWKGADIKQTKRVIIQH